MAVLSMTFFSEHVYLLAALLFFATWLLLLLFTPRGRWKEMVEISLLTMALGYFVEQMHLTDWWHPNFVFSGFVTIEDTLFGFSIGGIVYALFRIFCRSLRKSVHRTFPTLLKIALVGASFVSLFGLFYVLHASSFWASIISLCIPIVTAVAYKRQLLPPILLTGIALATFAFFGYQFALYMNPHFVTQTYYLPKLSGVLVFNIPIEELVWFFFASMGGAAILSIVVPDMTK